MPRFTLKSEVYDRLNAEYGGLCVMCGEEAHGVEPDARYYPCESCGCDLVFGVEELLLRGDLEIETD